MSVCHHTYFLCQPLRGLSVCKQLMLRWHFQFLHENHFSVSGYSGTVSNRGRNMINEGTSVSLVLFPLPCLWLHLHWLLCRGVCAGEQKFMACWRDVPIFFLVWVKLSSHSSFLSFPYTLLHHFPFVVRGWTHCGLDDFNMCEFSELMIQPNCKHYVLYSEIGQILEQVAQKSCGIPILGDTQTSPWALWSNQTCFEQEGGLGHFQRPFQAPLFCDLAVSGSSAVCDGWFVEVCIGHVPWLVALN